MWISVEDRFPYSGHQVLVFCPVHTKGKTTDVTYLTRCVGINSEGSGWSLPTCFHGDMVGNVTHWMPLPEPPDK